MIEMINDIHNEITKKINDLNSDEDNIIKKKNKIKNELIQNSQIEENKEEMKKKENIGELNIQIKDLEEKLKYYKNKMQLQQELFQKEREKTHLKYKEVIQNIIDNANNSISETEKEQEKLIKKLKNEIDDLVNKVNESKNIDEKNLYKTKRLQKESKLKNFKKLIDDFNKEKNNKIKEQIDIYLESFKVNINEFVKKEFYNQVNELLNSILNSQNNILIFHIKNHISNMTKSRSNELSQPINHLNVIITGRKEIGKTYLINKILKDNENKIINNINPIFTEYFSKNIPYLTLIESLGLNQAFKSEQLTKETKELINKRMNSKKIDSFIHSILFLFNSNRLENKTIESIKELHNEIPVIFIYTKVNNKNDIDPIKRRLKDNDFNGEFICLKKEIKDENINQIIEISKKGIQKSCIKFMIQIVRNDLKNIIDNIKVDKEIKDIGLKNIDTLEIFEDDMTQKLNNLISYIINCYRKGYKKDIINEDDNNNIFQLNKDITKSFLEEYKKKIEEICVKLIQEKSEDLVLKLIIIQQKYVKENKEYCKYIKNENELRKECKEQLTFNLLPSLINMCVTNLLMFLIEKLKTKIIDIFEQCIKDKDIIDFFENNITIYFS